MYACRQGCNCTVDGLAALAHTARWQAHGDVLSTEQGFAGLLDDVSHAHSDKWTRLRAQLQETLCLARYLRNPHV
jgi:hypothetical protein